MSHATILSIESIWLLCVDWRQLFNTSDIKILFYLEKCARQEARYSKLLKNVIQTRSVLSTSLQDLTKRKMVERIVEPTLPIQTRYKLTEKGIKVLQHLAALEKLVS